MRLAAVKWLSVLIGDKVAKKSALAMKKAGLRLPDLLADLDRQRDRYNRERDWPSGRSGR